jgi:small-conductance mechanosensitive channel
MTIHRKLALTFFGLVLGAVLTGIILTRDRGVQAPPTGKAGAKAVAAPVKERLVDETPLLTARRLLPLATTPEERQLAHQAERLANHEVDLAFTDALRQAHENPPAPTPETQVLLEHRKTQEAEVEADQQRIADLTRLLAASAPKGRDALEDQLEVAKAQLELDQDEVEQATEALQRVGGDPQARIQRLKAAHSAADVAPPAPPAPGFVYYQPGSFLAKAAQFKDASAKLAQVRQARQDSQAKFGQMSLRRIKFAERVAKEGESRQATKDQAAGFAQAVGARTDASKAVAKSTLQALKHHATSQRRLADYGRRIQDEADLGEVYGTWVGLVEGQRQAALHSVLQWFLAILGVVLAVLLADRGFERLFAKQATGPHRVGRLLKVVKFSTQMVGVLIILFLVFGLPSQMTTIFGLAGAGLTVAMKDFIVAFFGWFILVGRNGIHVGDWVEIRGVGGEVVEIGLLRTLLLETGDWNDASHPTGRIASFVNSFAMEGHFFNFSTAGQWMWDELRVRVPAERDPYAFIEAIRKLVEQATLANATLAQKEWAQASRGGRAPKVSAEPSVSMMPTGDGIEIRVRYLTRAYERHETQRNLNQALVELMHGKPEAAISL